MPRFRASILWLAAIFVVVGSTIGFAAKGGQSESHRKDAPHVEATTDEQGEEGTEQTSDESSGTNERKQNHGFFVSAAAHCEDVDDPNPDGTDFTAPEDCTGKAKGEYVSSVAKSSVGKPDKAKGPKPEGS